jgi:hypothetical protein
MYHIRKSVLKSSLGNSQAHGSAQRAINNLCLASLSPSGSSGSGTHIEPQSTLQIDLEQLQSAHPSPRDYEYTRVSVL